MADLIDRLSGADPSRAKITNRQFTSGLRLYALGLVTAQEIVQDWDLQGAELTQAQTLRAQIDGITGATAKMAYVLRVEAIATIIEITDDSIYHNADHTINKARVVQHLGL